MKPLGKFIIKILFFFALLLAVFANSMHDVNAQSPQKTGTGFYWPTGTENLGSYSGWLYDDCLWSQPKKYGSYVDGRYHIGKDIGPNLGAPVYPIADGTVVKISEGSSSGWPGKTKGSQNKGVFIEHQLSDGKKFLALYGHIVTNIKKDEKVKAGISFANVGPYDYEDNGKLVDAPHLHFAIVPTSIVPDEPYGRMPCPKDSPPAGIDGVDKHGFDDPILWITTRSPQNQNTPPAAPASSPSANLSWLTTSYSINIDIPWRYTFGFCNDSRPINLFLDDNLVLATSSQAPRATATVGLWPGDYAVRTEVLDTINGTSPELQMVPWPRNIDCKGQVLGTSAAAQATIAPVPTVAFPSTIIASSSSTLSSPTLVSPPNGGLISYTTAISLIWRPVAGATSYRVEFLGDQRPTSLPCGVNVNVICSFTDVRPGTLHWHVKAIGPDGIESDWSDAWSFTIQEPITTPSPGNSHSELIAYVDDGGNIWTIPATGGTPSRITTDGGNSDIRWSPDGKFMAFLHSAGNESELNIINSDGTGRKTYGPQIPRDCTMVNWAVGDEKILCLGTGSGNLGANVLYSFDLLHHNFTLLFEPEKQIEGSMYTCFMGGGCSDIGLDFAPHSKKFALISWVVRPDCDADVTLWILDEGGVFQNKYIIATVSDCNDVGYNCCNDPIWSWDEKQIAFSGAEDNPPAYTIQDVLAKSFIGILDTETGAVEKFRIPANGITFSGSGQAIAFSTYLAPSDPNYSGALPCENIIYKLDLVTRARSEFTNGCYPSWRP